MSSSTRRHYEVCLSADGLDLYDRSMHVMAILALAELGPAALDALRAASEHADPEARSAAILALAQAGDPELADRLLGLLRGTSDSGLIDTALAALVRLRAPRAIVLIEDLLQITGDVSDVHPVWGTSEGPSWSDDIHRILVAISADHEVAAAIDAALVAGNTGRKIAALRELSRWGADGGLPPERASLWKQASRGEQLVALALCDPEEPVRRAAANALRDVSSPADVESIERALDGGDPARCIRAARVLVALDIPSLHVRVRQALLAIATSQGPEPLRRAAGGVLSELPGGLEPVYHPIQAALERGEPQTALDLIARALEIAPDDVNLFWWRGNAQNELGLRAQAAASLRRALELNEYAVEIALVLADVLIDLQELAGAMEVARRGVELSAESADAHALLAWSCYRANTIAEAVSAARTACDLDPVHPTVIWILVLALLRTPAPGEARAAAQHALRVRELLSPGLDTSFLATFIEELGAIPAADEATAQVVAELRQRLAAPVQSSL